MNAQEYHGFLKRLESVEASYQKALSMNDELTKMLNDAVQTMKEYVNRIETLERLLANATRSTKPGREAA